MLPRNGSIGQGISRCRKILSMKSTNLDMRFPIPMKKKLKKKKNRLVTMMMMVNNGQQKERVGDRLKGVRIVH
jgi:hypothetical protein